MDDGKQVPQTEATLQEDNEEKLPPSPKSFEQDNLYAWVVCGASFTIHILMCAVCLSVGMFYIIFRQNMEGSSSAVSFVFSTNFGVIYLTGPIVGVLVSKFGWRIVGMLGSLLSTVGLILTSQATCLFHLYISYGFITGFGFALQYNPLLSVLPAYFNKWLGLANGIVVCGCGVGSTIFPSIIIYLEREFGWRGTLLLLAGTQLQTVACAALFRPVVQTTIGCDMKRPRYSDTKHGILSEDPIPQHSNEEGRSYYKSDKKIPISVKGSRLCQNMNLKLKLSLSIFKCHTYTLFCISQLLFATADTIIYTHYGAFALSRGFTDEHAAFLFLVIGISATLMRLLSGVLTHIQGITPLRLCFISISSLGVLTCLMPFYTTWPLLLMYGIMFGMLCGPYKTLILHVISDLFSQEKIPSALGYLFVFLAPGSLVGAPIAGFLYDATEVYYSSFYLAGTLMIIAGLINLSSMYLSRRSKTTSRPGDVSQRI